MKKLISLLLCVVLISGCTKQPQTVVQVVERTPIASENTSVIIETQTDNFNIPYPTIWGKMTDKPMIKGYRLPRPTFGYGWYEISPAKLTAIAVVVALVVKGLWSIWHKDTVNVIGNVTATPIGAFQANAQGNFNAVPNGEFQANAQGSFNAVPNGEFNANPNGAFNANPNGEFQANAQGSFNAKPDGNFDAVPKGEFQVNSLSHSESSSSLKNKSKKKFNISSSSSGEEKKKKITPDKTDVPPPSDVPDIPSA